MILAESRFLALLHFASFCEIGRTSTCTYLYILHTYLPLSLVRGNGPARPEQRRWRCSFLSFYFYLFLLFISLLTAVQLYFYWAACEAGQDEEGGRGGETAREPGGGSGIAARLSSFMRRSSDGVGGD